MANSGGSAKNPWVLALLLVVGSLTGSLLGQLLGGTLPFLKTGSTIELAPQTLKLAEVFHLTFGFGFCLNIATILGMALAIWVYRKL
ncbi:MAG TPA: DUF4321 domain-containing protein [Firmicutes bacterium]|nr:DUF4321 domain-containing protein [Bacillota bacterium]HOQ24019.1 DUF4321 domain-containing protein [Bacillota bacterium]HPT67417.1 DUF4321 domain-containing protein [Bacillota bacterium]